MTESICYCGHDCNRCVTRLATVHDDEALRLQAQAFYRDRFGLKIPLDQIHCQGGRSDDIFFLCRECPFSTCCRSRNLTSCADCPDYPCATLRDYQEKYVNRCNQIGD